MKAICTLYKKRFVNMVHCLTSHEAINCDVPGPDQLMDRLWSVTDTTPTCIACIHHTKL